MSKVFGVLLARMEHLEACSHGPVLRVSRRIKAMIRFGDGMLGVGGKIILEVFKVNALLTRDEPKRRFTVEVKAPQVP